MSTTNLSSATFTAPIVTMAKPKEYDATDAQLEIWLASKQSLQANCAYNEISSLTIKGTLNPDLLEEAVRRVILRNESLRSTFSADGRRVLIHDQVVLDWQSLDLSALDDDEQTSRQFEVIEGEGRKPFDLVGGPLIRFVFQRLSDTHHKLTFTAHHIVMDGWSLAVFCRDLGRIHDELSGKDCEPLPAPHQYSQYADLIQQYEQSDAFRSDQDFWKNEYGDEIPVLQTPTEYSRPVLKTYNSRRLDHHLASDLVRRLRRLGAKNGCSLFNTFLAAFQSYLGRVTGAKEVCLGVPAAGQAAMDQPELIGYCVNTLPLRTSVDQNATFLDFLKQSRTDLLDAFEHQRLAFGAILRMLAPPRDPSRSPIIDVSVNLDPVIDLSESGFEGFDVRVDVEPRCFEKFEWFINGVIGQDDSIELQIQYNTDLYSKSAVQFYFRGFQAFLEELAREPTRSIADYHLMSVPQRQRVIADWNETQLDYPVESTLHAEFCRQAGESPTRRAITFGEATLTYREVDEQSNRIARFLNQQGVGKGDLVGICVERSEQMLVNLYAILKSGAGYVPLDPAYPVDRLQYMCDHSGLKLVVTSSSLDELTEKFDKPLVRLDVHDADIRVMDSAALPNQNEVSDICYVIYTSGSTGKPKGVQVPHGAVVNFLYSMREQPGFTADDSLLAVTTLSFDISVLEMYLPTVTGGHVVVVDGAAAANGAALADTIDRNQITVLQATPSTWRLLIQNDWRGRPGLKALCGGEPMPADLVGPLLQRVDQLWNMYGPTETTVWSAVYQITEEDAPILIGKPIGNTQIYILDQNGNEVPVGCEGELYIGGAGVTLGYRGRPDLTDQRFVRNRYQNPFKQYVSRRLYKTGDVAKFRFDGNIEFMRRNDKQVKVRGFRIELGEIEQNLKSHPAIRQAVVIVREDTPGDAKLVAYTIADENEPVSSSDMRAHLRQSLPGYMVPQQFVSLQVMPQTNNGKIDYKNLPAPAVESVANDTADALAELTPYQRYMMDVWSDALQHTDVDLDDTFFDVGGHSLLVMQIIDRVAREKGTQLGPQDFLLNTLRQLAAKVGEPPLEKDCDRSAAPESTDESTPTLKSVADEKVPVPTEDAAASATIEVSEEIGASDGESKKTRLITKLKGFWD